MPKTCCRSWPSKGRLKWAGGAFPCLVPVRNGDHHVLCRINSIEHYGNIAYNLSNTLRKKLWHNFLRSVLAYPANGHFPAWWRITRVTSKNMLYTYNRDTNTFMVLCTAYDGYPRLRRTFRVWKIGRGFLLARCLSIASKTIRWLV